jgi:hypothetical protein
MLPGHPKHRRRTRWLIGGAAAVFLLAVTIDDWGRDLTENFAAISDDAPQPDLRPFVSRRSSAELAEAVRWAARRIKDWEYVGESTVDEATTLLFVRQGRVLRFTDDVIVRIEDRGAERVLTATSKARSSWGDLGRNPRNLRRLLTELQDVLDGSSNDPAPLGGVS